MARVARVRVSFEVDVPFPDDFEDHTIEFEVNDNSCPGTRLVGLAVSDLMDRHAESYHCEFCGPNNGKNELLSIDGVPISKE